MTPPPPPSLHPVSGPRVSPAWCEAGISGPALCYHWLFPTAREQPSTSHATTVLWSSALGPFLKCLLTWLPHGPPAVITPAWLPLSSPQEGDPTLHYGVCLYAEIHLFWWAPWTSFANISTHEPLAKDTEVCLICFSAVFTAVRQQDEAGHHRARHQREV